MGVPFIPHRQNEIPVIKQTLIIGGSVIVEWADGSSDVRTVATMTPDGVAGPWLIRFAEGGHARVHFA